MSNGLLAVLGGVFRGLGESKKRKTEEEYKKALIDYQKSMAKHMEQKINLDALQGQLSERKQNWVEQLLAGGAQGALTDIPPKKAYPGMSMQGMPGAPGAVQGAPVDLAQVIANTQAANAQGVGYEYGAKNPQQGAVDCSGWVCDNMRKMGINVADSAAGLAEKAYQVGGLNLINDPNTISPGMLLFNETETGRKEGRFGGIGHVGMVVEQGGRKYVSESGAGGPSLVPLEQYIAGKKGIWGAPISAYGQYQAAQGAAQRLAGGAGQVQQQPAGPAAGPTTAPGGRPLLTPRDKMSIALEAAGYGKLGAPGTPLKVDTGPEVLVLDPSDPTNVLARYKKSPEVIMQPGTDTYGRPTIIPMTKPRSEDLGAINYGQPIPVGPSAVEKGVQEGTQKKATEAVSGVSSDVAAKRSLVESGLSALDSAKSLIFYENGKVNYQNLTAHAVSFPYSEGRNLESLILGSIDSIVRAASGATINETEIPLYRTMYVPSPLDNEQTVKQKINRLDAFLNSYMNRMEPGILKRKMPQGEPAEVETKIQGKDKYQGVFEYDPATKKFKVLPK